MKITDIKAAVRSENRVNVFVDGEFCFSLDVAQAIEFKIKIGKTLDAAEIEKLKRASVFGKLYTGTLEWVFIRPRSIKETRDYLKLKLLKRKKINNQRKINKERLKENPELREKFKVYTREVELFTDEDIENVIKKLVEKKYLDDEKFAEYYVENRNVKKGISEKKLKDELRKKGISADIINMTLEKSERKPEDEIRKIILKKKNKYNEPKKLLAYIMRQGFSYELAKTEVEKIFSGESFNE